MSNFIRIELIIDGSSVNLGEFMVSKKLANRLMDEECQNPKLLNRLLKKAIGWVYEVIT